MGTISSLGIASGIDSNSIVSQLVALDKAPLTVLQQQATVDNSQISAFATITSEFSDLSDACTTLQDPTTWEAKTASSSNTAAASISVTSAAAAGSFTLDVDQLAQAQSVGSSPIVQGSLTSGNMVIQLGTWTQANSSATPPTTLSFAPSGASSVSISVLATDTVASIAAKINAANAGVTATDFNDGTNDRLLLSSSTTGVAAGFKVTTTDTTGAAVTDGTGISQLAFDPTQSSDANSGAYGMASASNTVQYGANAMARINGLAVTSQTNTLTGNLPGVTINLLATTTTGYGTSTATRNPATMSVSDDVTGVVTNIQTFVTAYNKLFSDLQTNLKYDPTSDTAGLFQGDGTIVNLQNLMYNLVGSESTGSTAYSRLSDAGIQVQADGTLAINSATLSVAANNGTQLQDLFTTNTGSDDTSGFAVKFGDFAAGAIAAGGLVADKTTALQAVLAKNTADQADVTDKANTLETRLKAQYSALDSKMATLNALASYVSQQVTTWNKSSS